MKNLIVILGVPGVGKTATCDVLKNILPKNLLIDGDEVWKPTPFIYDQEAKDLFYKNIVYLLNNYFGYSKIDNIIFPYIVPREEVLQEQILDMLNLKNVRLHIFALTCTEQEHANRINNDTNPRRKNTSLGSSIEKLKNYKTIKDEIIDTTTLTPSQVAEQIKKTIGK